MITMRPPLNNNNNNHAQRAGLRLVILLINKLENTWAMIDWRTNFRREFIFYIFCIFLFFGR